MIRPYSRRALLDVFHRVGAARTGGRWTLASGKESDFYVDARKVVTDPVGALLLADGFLGPLLEIVGEAIMHQTGPVYVVSGGAGGSLLLGAVMAWAGCQDVPHLRGVLIRDRPKDHGTGQLAEGNLPPDGRRSPAVVIDDVLTTGGSIRGFVDAVKDRLDVKSVVVAVDREEGGMEELARDFHVNYLLRRADLEPVAVKEPRPLQQPEQSDEHAESDEDVAEKEALVEQSRELRDTEEEADNGGRKQA